MRVVRRLLGFIAAVVLLGAGVALAWLHHPMGQAVSLLDLSIEPGMTPRAVAQASADAGLDVDPSWLFLWFRLSGQSRKIKAGSYEIAAGTTPWQLLSKLARGEASLRAVTLVEGWNFRQVREALARADQLKPTTSGLSNEAIMAALGRAGQHPEGRFFPDTYTYSKGASDLSVLQRAARAMDRQLQAAWAQRRADIVLGTPEEALILASVVEKETGRAADRALIAAVFQNRLRRGMLLQTDPTVIYGMGERFDGNLRRRDLLADTPYNSYTRGGLPPTPIAMPGKAALLAAVQPANSPALYFVARGDGSSAFSETLNEHNRAVNIYQRRGAPASAQ